MVRAPRFSARKLWTFTTFFLLALACTASAQESRGYRVGATNLEDGGKRLAALYLADFAQDFALKTAPVLKDKVDFSADVTLNDARFSNGILTVSCFPSFNVSLLAPLEGLQPELTPQQITAILSILREVMPWTMEFTKQGEEWHIKTPPNPIGSTPGSFDVELPNLTRGGFTVGSTSYGLDRSLAQMLSQTFGRALFGGDADRTNGAIQYSVKSATIRDDVRLLTGTYPSTEYEGRSIREIICSVEPRFKYLRAFPIELDAETFLLYLYFSQSEATRFLLLMEQDTEGKWRFAKDAILHDPIQPQMKLADGSGTVWLKEESLAELQRRHDLARLDREADRAERQQIREEQREAEKAALAQQDASRQQYLNQFAAGLVKEFMENVHTRELAQLDAENRNSRNQTRNFVNRSEDFVTVDGAIAHYRANSQMIGIQRDLDRLAVQQAQSLGVIVGFWRAAALVDARIMERGKKGIKYRMTFQATPGTRGVTVDVIFRYTGYNQALVDTVTYQ